MMARRSVLFRFHTGSIKRTHVHPTGHKVSCFDSILVRLKVSCQKNTAQPSFLRFDSILVRLKVAMCDNLLLSCAGFRFHTGSIKREFGLCCYFNNTEFRFHTGSIKRVIVLYVSYAVPSSFDSILVRLKVTVKPSHITCPVCSFDSILVRLKVSRGNSVTSVTGVFRFHTGSIKKCIRY